MTLFLRLVENTLPEDANIYASEYQLYLPDKKELQKKRFFFKTRMYDIM